ncbi:odorant receptor 4-like [Ostrinia nubilalis]|uniref:odorant receptor 4-like n=1 Tax=Ostrinia nubilalis TaxID=29057 RepID=UPI00308254D4
MEVKDQLRQKKKENDVIYKDEISFLHSLIKVLHIAYSVLVMMFLVNPLILIGYKYYRTKEWDLVLPFLILYPFDSHDIKYWPFVYLHQIWSNVVVNVYICSSDFILYTCCTFITIQFRLLQSEIKDLVKENTTLKNFKTSFREMVMWHQDLIRCTQTLEVIYSKSILFNFISSSVLICLTGFDVLVLTDKIMVISFVSFLLTSLLQIFFVCFFGDLLMRSSMGVGDAAYKCLWYGKEPFVGKNLLLMMIRSSKPCKITAYGFADVNLTAFMRILSNAWSYFALLKTIVFG